MGVSKNRGGPPKSYILIGFRFSIINHPFWGTPIFGNTHILHSKKHRANPQGMVKWHDAPRWQNAAASVPFLHCVTWPFFGCFFLEGKNPRDPITSWEGIWTLKTYQKHILRRWLDPKRNKTRGAKNEEELLFVKTLEQQIRLDSFCLFIFSVDFHPNKKSKVYPVHHELRQ